MLHQIKAPQFYKCFLKLIFKVKQSNILMCKSVFYISFQTLKTVGTSLKSFEKSLNFTQTCLYEPCDYLGEHSWDKTHILVDSPSQATDIPWADPEGGGGAEGGERWSGPPPPP